MSLNNLCKDYSKVFTVRHNTLNPLEPHILLINTCMMHDTDLFNAPLNDSVMSKEKQNLQKSLEKSR